MHGQIAALGFHFLRILKFPLHILRCTSFRPAYAAKAARHLPLRQLRGFLNFHARANCCSRLSFFKNFKISAAHTPLHFVSPCIRCESRAAFALKAIARLFEFSCAGELLLSAFSRFNALMLRSLCFTHIYYSRVMQTDFLPNLPTRLYLPFSHPLSACPSAEAQ